MLRHFLLGKIHRATVTRADIDYVGSITIDVALIEAAGFLENEKIDIYDVTNGARLSTYVIPGRRGSGEIGINGAAAHLVKPGRPRHHRQLRLDDGAGGRDAPPERRSRRRARTASSSSPTKSALPPLPSRRDRPATGRVRSAFCYLRPPPRGDGDGEKRVLLRRRSPRGRPEEARSARRKRRGPRRDDGARPPGAAGLHDRDGPSATRFATSQSIPDEARAEVDRGARAPRERRWALASATPRAPLLVSVRSGARASMPGMMDTILNLGLNDAVVEGLAARTKSPRFAYDAYRRFVAMHANIALGVSREPFEHALDEARARVAEAKGVDRTRLNAEELKRAVPDSDIPAEELRSARRRAFKAIVKQETGQRLPERSARAALAGDRGGLQVVEQPPRHRLPPDARHPGRLGDRLQRPGDGLRQPGRHERHGRRVHARPVDRREEALRRVAPERAGRGRGRGHSHAAADPAPAAAGRTNRSRRRCRAPIGSSSRIAATLETHFRDMQDLEFTIQDGKLYMLQCRTGEARGARGRAHRGRHGERGAHHARRRPCCASIPAALDQLLHPTLDPKAPKQLLARGLAASPGAASGHIVFSADEAERRAGQGKPVILVRVETSPEDIHGMKAARGILTARGGMTSHAAVVARGMGKPCVAGVSAVAVNYETQTMTVTVYDDARPAHRDRHAQEGRHHHDRRRQRPRLRRRGADRERRAQRRVRRADVVGRRGANDEGARQRRHARSTRARRARFGAEGIGLCRTEHMFFEEERIEAMREMILADDSRGRGRGAREAPAVPARGLHRPLPRDARPARSPSACSTRRCTSSCRPSPSSSSSSRARWGSRCRSSRSARRTCTSSTRCSATAAAASPSRTPRSTRCRRAPSSRPRCQVGERGDRGAPGDHDPARDHARSSSRRRAPSSTTWRRRSSRRRASACRSRSAR